MRSVIGSVPVMTLWEFKGANNVGSCYVPVGSGVQTDATYTFQQCWDLQCIVGRVQRIRLCKPCVMCVRGVVTMLEELCHSRPQSRSFVFPFVLLVTVQINPCGSGDENEAAQTDPKL